MVDRKEIFIKKGNLIHVDKYDYSNVVYGGISEKVEITCPIHGVFYQTPHHHIQRKQGCGKCRYINISKKTRSTKENFIKKAKEKHGDKYDYSLVNYINRKTKVKIICKEHGVFEQEPHNHIRGQECGRCAGLYKTNEHVINQAKKTHGNKYDYSLVDYIANDKKIKIICKEHGVFEQLTYAHIKTGQGCPRCFGLYKTSEQFISDSKIIHGNKYDYYLVDYKHSKRKVKIKCQTHGMFEQTPNMHLKGQGCPICRESSGEREIRTYLIKHSVKYIQQYKFINCRNVQELPFDFYLPELNICIEYDGIQHYKPISAFGGEKGFLATKINDEIKTKYCDKNNIKLLRIGFNENIYNSLNNFLVIKKHS